MIIDIHKYLAQGGCSTDCYISALFCFNNQSGRFHINFIIGLGYMSHLSLKIISQTLCTAAHNYAFRQICKYNVVHFMEMFTLLLKHIVFIFVI